MEVPTEVHTEAATADEDESWGEELPPKLPPKPASECAVKEAVAQRAGHKQAGPWVPNAGKRGEGAPTVQANKDKASGADANDQTTIGGSDAPGDAAKSCGREICGNGNATSPPVASSKGKKRSSHDDDSDVVEYSGAAVGVATAGPSTEHTSKRRRGNGSSSEGHSSLHKGSKQEVGLGRPLEGRR